jgi:hypothetical protein
MTSNLTYVPTRISHNPKQRMRSAAHAQRLAAAAYHRARVAYRLDPSSSVEHQELGAQLSKHARLCMGMKD